MSRIRVLLLRDRTLPGRLEIRDGAGVLVHHCQCLGKADSARAAARGKHRRDPVLSWGDTPTGAWNGCAVADYDGSGRLGSRVIWLGAPIGGRASAGDAVVAARNGRTELAIHGGRGDGRLVPTFGCLRVRDGDMAALDRVLAGEAFSVAIEEVDELEI